MQQRVGRGGRLWRGAESLFRGSKHCNEETLGCVLSHSICRDPGLIHGSSVSKGCHLQTEPTRSRDAMFQCHGVGGAVTNNLRCRWHPLGIDGFRAAVLLLSTRQCASVGWRRRMLLSNLRPGLPLSPYLDEPYLASTKDVWTTTRHSSLQLHASHQEGCPPEDAVAKGLRTSDRAPEPRNEPSAAA